MAALVDLSIAGRTYQVACREGEEENLRAAARLVDGKSREAIAGLGTLSEARQFLFASTKPPRAVGPRFHLPRRQPGSNRRSFFRPNGSLTDWNRSRVRLRKRQRRPRLAVDGHYPVRAFGKSLRR